jgi:hypothetical protein
MEVLKAFRIKITGLELIFSTWWAGAFDTQQVLFIGAQVAVVKTVIITRFSPGTRFYVDQPQYI